MLDARETDRADTALLTEAAELAGEIALSHFQKDPKVYDKEDGSPVTAADLEVNAFLREHLLGARPDYGWLSEEDADDPARLDMERVIIVDPIDGTRSFIAGDSGFSVAIAVVSAGEVRAAAVHLPARDETFAATLGRGAVKDGQPIMASAAATPHEASVLTARKQLDEENWPGGVPPLNRHFRSSLAWRMCLVAEARFDCMLTFRSAYEWDIAAGALIASEAGARVTDGHGGLMRFNSPEGMQAGVIAAPEMLHQRLMSHRAPR